MAKSLVGTGREPVQEPPNHHPGELFHPTITSVSILCVYVVIMC